MGTYNLRLSINKPKAGDIPFRPTCHIALKTWSKRDHEMFISHDCLSIGELRFEVERLKKELDHILTKGLAVLGVSGRPAMPASGMGCLQALTDDELAARLAHLDLPGRTADELLALMQERFRRRAQAREVK